jgi:hypothetical protein
MTIYANVTKTKKLAVVMDVIRTTSGKNGRKNK